MGRHLVLECPVNEEARKANINEARTWEDLDDKAMVRKREWNVKAFFGKATSSKGWGDKHGAKWHSRISFVLASSASRRRGGFSS